MEIPSLWGWHIPGESIFAIVGAILFSISYISQIVRVYRRERAEDISWWFLCIISGAVFMYVVYGFTHKDYVLMASYSIILFLVLVLMSLKYRYHVIRFPKGDDEDRRITTTHDAPNAP